MRFIGSLITIFISLSLLGQEAKKDKLSFTGDFRFRLEQDWDSRKYDGSFRDNRSRLRYRLRFGSTYLLNDWASFGMRVRTGHPSNPQDPQITLGKGFKEFGNLPISFEKAFFSFDKDWISGWLGKNTFPFEKQNELFWSDNVYPDGVHIQFSKSFENRLVENVKLNLAHMIFQSNDKSFDKDSYVQGAQIVSNLFNKKLKLFPSFYYFRRMPDIPDGQHSFHMNYSIFHLGSNFTPIEKIPIKITADFYKNLEDYSSNLSISNNLNDQNTGFVGSLSYGNLKDKKDWKAACFYTYLERFSAVDFLTQNDWTRWDYSSFNSPAGRLTNFKGLELFFGFMIDKNIKFNTRYFNVKQIVPYGAFKESGQRIRFDIDVTF